MSRSLAAQFGTTLPGRLAVRGEHTREVGAVGFERLMRMKHRPDEVFCANDAVAIGAMDEAEELDVGIPGEVALIGHDDAQFASLGRPRLTTVTYPAVELGRAAAQPLVERLNGRVPRKTVHVKAEFISRGTV
ncbi:substrate-binding domain-containing protein [Streptomyces sp. ADI93-02]|uniref:substrate-binding domain-containing protein n=1 Tax=Streptomyces sp. ADI93-02 TaxID=1522757 RepID=UPI001F151827|nr:substrate-binding domain-containing protein [Streptomyces sp. ADI93-02]